MIAALRGAIGFFTRLPIGQREADWSAFVSAPWTFPVVGYLIGVIVAIPLATTTVGAVPAPTVALAALIALYAVTGITHLDGVADLGDAAVVHGDADDRRRVMRDADLGVGGTLALVLVVVGVTAGLLGVVTIAAVPAREGTLVAVGLVIAAEVSARSAAGTLVCVSDAAHEGLGSAVTEASTPRAAPVVIGLALPAVLLGWPRVVPAVAALVAAFGTAVALQSWAVQRLGGVSGDVLGATTEIARVAALHAGVIAWTLS